MIPWKGKHPQRLAFPALRVVVFDTFVIVWQFLSLVCRVFLGKAWLSTLRHITRILSRIHTPRFYRPQKTSTY